jgi:hypothetical protein
MSDQFSIRGAAALYGGLWIVQFFMTLVAAFAANTVYHVPLYQVADVTLSANYVIIIGFEALFAVLLVLMLLGRQVLAALKFFVIMMIYGLLIFSPAVALQLFAWIAHVQLVQESRLYAMLLNLLTNVFGPLMSGAAKAATDPAARAQMQSNISFAGTVLSIIIALFQLPKVLGSLKRAEAA